MVLPPGMRAQPRVGLLRRHAENAFWLPGPLINRLANAVIYLAVPPPAGQLSNEKARNMSKLSRPRGQRPKSHHIQLVTLLPTRRSLSGFHIHARFPPPGSQDAAAWLLAFTRHHPESAFAIAFIVSFGESFAGLSFLVAGHDDPDRHRRPAARHRCGSVGLPSGLAGGRGGAILGDWISYWIGYRFKELVLSAWPISHYRGRWTARCASSAAGACGRFSSGASPVAARHRSLVAGISQIAVLAVPARQCDVGADLVGVLAVPRRCGLVRDQVGLALAGRLADHRRGCRRDPARPRLSRPDRIGLAIADGKVKGRDRDAIPPFYFLRPAET